MNEFLFFQDAKKELKIIQDQENIRQSPQLQNRKMSTKKILTMPIRQHSSSFLDQTVAESPFKDRRYSEMTPKVVSKKISMMDTSPKNPEPLKKKQTLELMECSYENLEQTYNQISNSYVDEYIKAGYPPQICAQLAGSLCHEERAKQNILSVGCGKGEIGQALREIGFRSIYGIDSNKSLLDQALDTRSFAGTDRINFGQENMPIPLQYIGKHDFVVCHSLMNNMLDTMEMSIETILQQFLDCLKDGGYAIFATKLDVHDHNIYEPEIKSLETNGYWKFVTDYKFYRYDKLGGNKVGKFSPKKVHYLVYQKIDHIKWLTDQENLRLAEIAEKERLAYVTQMMKQKMQNDLARKQNNKNKAKGRRNGIRFNTAALSNLF